MAIKLSDKPNTLAPSSEYPYGDIQDTITGVLPGTPVNREVYADIHQFFDRIFGLLGKAHNGLPDNNVNGFQLVESLVEFNNSLNSSVMATRVFPSLVVQQDYSFGESLYVAITGLINPSDNGVYTSPDGTNWTAQTIPLLTQPLRKIAYGNGTFIAFSGFSIVGDMLYSSDGITWTAQPNPGLLFPRDIVFTGGLFFLVGGDNASSPSIMTSTDGITWNTPTTPDFKTCNSVIYGNGLYVVLRTDKLLTDQILTSPDAITWTARPVSFANNWNQITFGNGVFVTIGSSTGNKIMYSYDAITWVDIPGPNNNVFFSVTYGNGKFIAISSVFPQQLIQSFNGIDWNATNNEDLTGGDFIYFANNLFLIRQADASKIITTV